MIETKMRSPEMVLSGAEVRTLPPPLPPDNSSTPNADMWAAMVASLKTDTEHPLFFFDRTKLRHMWTDLTYTKRKVPQQYQMIADRIFTHMDKIIQGECFADKLATTRKGGSEEERNNREEKQSHIWGRMYTDLILNRNLFRSNVITPLVPNIDTLLTIFGPPSQYRPVRLPNGETLQETICQKVAVRKQTKEYQTIHRAKTQLHKVILGGTSLPEIYGQLPGKEVLFVTPAPQVCKANPNCTIGKDKFGSAFPRVRYDEVGNRYEKFRYAQRIVDITFGILGGLMSVDTDKSNHMYHPVITI
jgi:hypothetical protein